MTVVRALTEADLAWAQRIVRVAFGTFLGVPDPERFWSDLDYVYGRFGAEHTAAFAAENDEGALTGVNFATRWGSVGFFGPLAGASATPGFSRLRRAPNMSGSTANSAFTRAF